MSVVAVSQGDNRVITASRDQLSLLSVLFTVATYLQLCMHESCKCY